MVATLLPPDEQFPGDYYDVFEEFGIPDTDSEFELDEELGLGTPAASQAASPGALRAASLLPGPAALGSWARERPVI